MDIYSINCRLNIAMRGFLDVSLHKGDEYKTNLTELKNDVLSACFLIWKKMDEYNCLFILVATIKTMRPDLFDDDMVAVYKNTTGSIFPRFTRS